MGEQGWEQTGQETGAGSAPCPQAVRGVLWGPEAASRPQAAPVSLKRPGPRAPALALDPAASASGAQSHACRPSPTQMQGQEERELQMVYRA